jgi:cytochrome c oxidase subunit 2
VRNRPVMQMVVIGVIATAIGIPIALVIPWFPTEASKQANNVKTLYDVLLIASVPIFVLVETVVLFSVWKFRMKPGQENQDGPPIHGNTRLEVIWTALPALLVIGLCTFAYTKLRSNEDSRPGAMTVNVTERQFTFEFSYDRGGQTITTPDLYMPTGQQVQFKLTSVDVIHSFFVPDFSEKIDAVPGITTTLRVTANRVGEYPVECTELCGAGHSLMRAAVHVVSPSAFRTWLQSQKAGAALPIGAPPPNADLPGIPGGSGAGSPSSSSTSSSSGSTTSTAAPTTTTGSSAATSPAAGKAVFTGSSGCGSCHTLAAAGTSGQVGPNLGTAIVGDAKKAGMPLKQFIQTSIQNPNAYISPGFKAGLMPQNFAQSLTPTQIQGLVNFLASVTK